MKNYKSADIRNFAVVGHGSSGKTMLCESMLLCGGAINRLGSILQGSTASDYHQDEQAHKISIHSCLLHAEWLDKKLNIIDTPGYLDFISDSLGALRVADFALVVIHASHGVEVGTEQVWDFATRFSIPKIIVVNGLDNENTNFDHVLAQLRERLGRRLFFDLGSNGRTVTLSGVEPLGVLLGNSSNVSIRVNGFDYSIPAANRRGNTARLTIYGQ